MLFPPSVTGLSLIQSALGGALIGLASWLLLASLGKIAGISGIVSGVLPSPTQAGEGDRAWRVAFLLGLLGAGTVAAYVLGVPAQLQADVSMQGRSPVLLMAAGLLVGLGTVLGSGCTSGHGVCGLGRRSVRSIVATVAFMGAGMATVTLVRFVF